MQEEEKSALDRARREKVREVLLALENAVSAARLFPAEHPTVGNFISDLHQRFAEYLVRYGDL